MNKVILMGRLTRDPEVRYSQGDNPMAIEMCIRDSSQRVRVSNHNIGVSGIE